MSQSLFIGFLENTDSEKWAINFIGSTFGYRQMKAFSPIGSYKATFQIVVCNLCVTSVFQTLYNLIMMGVAWSGQLMCLFSHQNRQKMFVL